MKRNLIIATCSLLILVNPSTAEDGTSESDFLSNTRQLTFEGKRAGEGYFGANGTQLVFQSERLDANPFYQIFLMDLETGDVEQVSPGHGKTTCAWIHSSGTKVLFASTHHDPNSVDLQNAELEFRASGQTRRYSWDYDEEFELYAADLDADTYDRLTDARGYDAEGSYSPDGEWIAFASNRHAYTETLSEEDAAIFEKDKSYMMDIYLTRADGSEVKRLTSSLGYDGGPFFSPDGSRIVWRRFAANGATAEIYSMNVDGSDQTRLTRLDVMSWAPYYHPSGDYIIFTNNSEGFGNFELHLVDAAGKSDPVRVTYTDGFDGLPVFSPDGERLCWTSNRTGDDSSQIFIADWNDAAAREALGIGASTPEVVEVAPAREQTREAIDAGDMQLHIERLAAERMEGRRTGTIGELRATAYVAAVFEQLGLQPAGDNGSYFQEFDFTAGIALGDNNELMVSHTADGAATALSRPVADEWNPLSFSRIGEVESLPVAFAGYGIKAPEGEGVAAYDSYVHLDVTDKWVMMFRYIPDNQTDDWNYHIRPYASLRYKAMTARELGAAGIIFVSGPGSDVENQLIPLTFDTMLGGTSLAAISVTDATAESWLAAAGAPGLEELEATHAGPQGAMGFALEGLSIAATIDIEQITKQGRNVLGRLAAKSDAGDTAIMVGAHVDHLGIGRGSGSLARDNEADAIHYGADDNASGVAGVIEIAQYLVDQKSKGLDMQHDVVFAAWSGEELGLLGAKHFVNSVPGKKEGDLLGDLIPAYLNMDMIGRLDAALVVQGVGSSSIWPSEIERRNAPVGLPIITDQDAYLPTDASEFYLRGVPILNAFTGAHEDYHRPSDTPDKINHEGAADIAKFMGLIARSLVISDAAPDYIEIAPPENMERRANLRAYLGTIPDYASGDVKGVKLSGVTKGAPADEAGLQMGDVVVQLGDKTIENIYDYTFAIEAMRPGEEFDVVVVRDGERVELKITPGSRD